jgi:ABC-type glycerol-3-phosphate transport system permease component
MAPRMTRGLRFAARLAIVGWSLGPFVWMALASFSAREELLANSGGLLPRSWTLESYILLFGQPDFLSSISRSTAIALLSTMLTVGIAAGASYSLTRYRITGMAVVQYASVWAYLFAPVVVVIPLFIILRSLSLTGTLVGAVAANVGFCFPFAMWLLIPFARGIPQGLEDAAAADGASTVKTLVEVVLPVARPGLLAVAAFCFALAWSDYLFARVLLGAGQRTLPVFISDLSTTTVLDWGMLMAAGTVSVIPVVLLVVVFHRQLDAGLSGAGIRG